MNELFLKVINLSISASWLVLAVLILRLVLRKAPKWVNVLLWGIVAVKLICPFSFESTLSLIPSSETIPLNIEMNKTPTIDSGINAINNVVNPIISNFNTPANGASINPLQITVAIFENIWVLGIVALLVYAAISYWRLCRKVDTAVRYKDNIFQSENVISPFVLGIIRPKIYLPFQMDTQVLKHVIAHEQAHIRRKDHWWKPLGFLLLSIHWFNPLMWVAYVLLCRDIELACDEKVIKDLGNEQRADYTQALVACSVNRRMIAACPLAFGELGVKERVKKVMNYKKPTFLIVAFAVIVCIIVAICFLTVPNHLPHTPIILPAVDEIDSINITTFDGSQVSYSDKEWIEKFITLVRQAEPTAKESIQDFPNSEIYGKVDISNNGGTTTFFYYSEDANHYIEQPYQGIYETDIDIDAFVDAPTETWAMIPMVMVNGTLYLDTGYESTIGARCGVMDGEITSQVEGNKKPSVDDQSNFGTGYGYQYGATEGTIELYIDGNWRIFATEEVRQEIQFPSKSDEPNKFYLTIGAKSVKSIELSTPNSSGGCVNADGSLFKKGERIWLESLDGCSDLRGLTITALGKNGEIIWNASIPNTEENKSVTHLTQDDWVITNIE